MKAESESLYPEILRALDVPAPACALAWCQGLGIDHEDIMQVYAAASNAFYERGLGVSNSFKRRVARILCSEAAKEAADKADFHNNNAWRV